MDLREVPRIGVGRTAEVYAWGEGRVLKLYRDWTPERWVEEERLGTALAHQAGLPAPAVHGVEVVEGRRGIVFERLEGPSLMSEVGRKPWLGVWAARTLAEVHAAIHARRVPGDGMPTMRQRLRWCIADSGLPEDLQRRAGAALEGLPDGEFLCHCDLHPDNVILTRRGPVVIDWGAACVGHPLADVARTALTLRIGCAPGARPPGPVASAGRALLTRAYLRRYLRSTGAARREVDAWALPVGVARAHDRILEERPALLATNDRLAAGAGGAPGESRADASRNPAP
jgi:aminoglycoside phosphotransferase (APT) family kinase protein